MKSKASASPRTRPSWNTYLTDGDQFKLSREEILRKKKLLVSKHNILTSKPPTRRTRPVRRPRSKKTGADDGSSYQSVRRQTEEYADELTSLDLIQSNDDEEDLYTPIKPVVSAKSSLRDNPKLKPDNKKKTSKPGMQYEPNRKPKTSLSHPPTSEDNGKVSTDKGHISLSQKEMAEISNMIETLNGELRYYEQLSGKRSAIDVEELSMALGLSNGSTESLRPVSVLRYLVQLVCQTMTYMLAGEVERNKQQDAYTALLRRVDKLEALSTGTLQKEPNIEKYSSTFSSPAIAGTDQRVTTPGTDRTVDLFRQEEHTATPIVSSHVTTPGTEKGGIHTPVMPPCPPSDDRHISDRTNTPDTVARHVSFNLSTAESNNASETKNFMGRGYANDDDEHSNTSHFGTATSDWLFSPAAALVKGDNPSTPFREDFLASPYTKSLQRSDNTSYHSSTEHNYTAESGTSTPLAGSNSRMLELQRQVAILRHDRTGTNGEGIRTAPRNSTTNDPLREWMKWSGGDSREVTSNNIGGSSNVKNTEAPPPPPPMLARVSSSNSTASIHVPSVIPAVDTEELMYDESWRSNRGHVETADEEAVSSSAIPSRLLPTPEKPPSYPFPSPQTSQHAQSIEAERTEYSRPSYDARNGSYGL